MGAFDDLIPGSKPEGSGTFDDLVPKATVGGALKNFGASAIEGLGSIAQGGGEAVAAGLNAITDSQQFRAVNPLKGIAEAIKDSMSAGDKAAMQDQAKGDILKPDTWQLPQTAGGYIHSAANVLGSLAPTLATAAIARGNMGPAMAAQGGLMTAGAAADDVRENFGKLDDTKLAEASPRFRELLAKGFTPADARAKIENESAQMAGLLSGVAGAAGGAVNARLLEDLIAHKGVPALLGKALADKPVARTLTGGISGALGEGFQETAEKVGQNAGENVGMGKSLTDDVTRDTFGDFVGGAIGGKATGSVGGFLSKPGHVTTPSGGQIDPTAGPVSSAAATAVSTGSAQRAADTAAQQDATKQDGEASKAMAGKPEFTDPQQWFDSLNGTGQRTLIEKLDGGERETALELMATARHPETSDPIREKAAGMLYAIAQNIGLPGTVAPVSPLALPAPQKDPAQAGRDNVAEWSKTAVPYSLDEAQKLQQTAIDNGRNDMVVVPHASGQGYTVVPKTWVGNTDIAKESGAIQGEGNGQLPSPNTPRNGTLIAGKDGVRQQTYGDLNTTANRAISEASATLGERKPQPAQTVRNAEPTNDVSTKVAPGPVEGEYIRGRQAAEQFFPFKSAEQAEARAMAATKEFGEEYGVEPHPSVKGSFAVVPASKAQQNAGQQGAPNEAYTPKTGGTKHSVLPNPANKQLLAGSPTAQGLEQQSAQSRNIAETAPKPRADAPQAQKLLSAPVDEAAHAAATSPQNGLKEPTPAQIDAGNYQKGHVNIGGLNISVENPSGSTRSGVSPDGKAWNTTMRDHYGYIKRTTGADKDQVDVFIKGGTPPDHSGDVYVVDQVDPKTGSFDEHKAMIGYKNQIAAAAAYRLHYEKGWKGMGPITPMPMAEFKSWVKSPEAAKPLALRQPDGMYVEVEGKRYPVDSLQQASEMNHKARKEAEARGKVGRIPDVTIKNRDGIVIGYVGPGDVVYEGNNFNPLAKNKRLYDPLDDYKKAYALKAKSQLFVTFDGQKFKVDSVEDAQAKWDAFKKESNGGGSEIGNGVVVTDSDGKEVASISYNGRVWPPGEMDKIGKKPALENKPNDGIPQPVTPTVRDERAPSDSAAAPDKPTGTPARKARSVVGANKRAGLAATDVADSAASVADAGQSQGDGAGVATSPEIVALRTRASVLKSLKACLG